MGVTTDEYLNMNGMLRAIEENGWKIEIADGVFKLKSPIDFIENQSNVIGPFQTIDEAYSYLKGIYDEKNIYSARRKIFEDKNRAFGEIKSASKKRTAKTKTTKNKRETN